jgi:hypothetical protein
LWEGFPRHFKPEACKAFPNWAEKELTVLQELLSSWRLATSRNGERTLMLSLYDHNTLIPRGEEGKYYDN